MNKRQKLVQQRFLNNEEAVITALKSTYGQALDDVNARIKILDLDIDSTKTAIDMWEDYGGGDDEKAQLQSMMQSKIYQKRYQEAIQGQLEDVMEKLQNNAYTTVASYLKDCYDDGFIGTLYDLQGQGVPLIMPMDQESIVRAVQLDSKISGGLYSRMGEDVAKLKKAIASEVSRGIATGMTYDQVAKQITYKMTGTNYKDGGALARAKTIARTEGHRIQVQAGMDACYKARDMGADVLKQWDATLDDVTRESHQQVDGEVRELDVKFSNGLMFPGDSSGGAAEVVNCRCALLQRARWALKENIDPDTGEVTWGDGDSFTKMDGRTGQLVDFKGISDYDQFKKEYWKKAEEIKEQESKQRFTRTKAETQKTVDEIDKELALLEERLANSADFNEWIEIEERQNLLVAEKQKMLKAQKTAEAKKAVSAAEDKLKSGYFINDPEKFVTQINLDGCDSQIADSVLSAFDKAFDRFPMLRGKFAGISMSNDLPDLAMAETTVGGWIKLNSRSFSEYNALLTKCKGNFANGSLVARNPEELVLHEIGHAFSMFAKYDWTTDEGYSATFVKGGTIAGRIKKAVQKECGAVDIGSRYAATNDDEWFAEAFTLYCTDRTDSPVMQSFSKQIEKIVKGLIK